MHVFKHCLLFLFISLAALKIMRDCKQFYPHINYFTASYYSIFACINKCLELQHQGQDTQLHSRLFSLRSDSSCKALSGISKQHVTPLK